MSAVVRAIHSIKTDLQQCDQDGIRISVVWEALDKVIEQHAELLDALKTTTDQLERVGDTRPHKDGRIIDAARSVISKAENT